MSITNCFTSIFAAIIIFAILGFKVHIIIIIIIILWSKLLYLVNLYNPDFNVRYKIILFQAHKSLEHCLATRAEILEGIGGTESAVEPAESADSMFTWAVVDGDNVTVPICDLQRELDKVRSKAGHVRVTREPFNSLSYQKCRRYCRFIAWQEFNFHNCFIFSEIHKSQPSIILELKKL